MDFDTILVGNGAVSSALALRLSEAHPDHRLALVGPAARPGGASLAAGAMLNVFAELTPGSLDPPLARKKFHAAMQSSALWEGHLATLGRRLRDTPEVRVVQGTHVVANSLMPELDDIALEAIVGVLREHRQRFREIDPNAIAGLAPAARRRPRRALFLEDEGTVSAEHLHRAYDEAFARSPSVSVLDAEVTAIRPAGDRSRPSVVVLRDGRTLTARQVVVAAGARSQALIAQLGLAEKIPRLVHGLGVALILKADAAVPAQVVRTPNRGLARGLYVVPYARGYCYVGATNDVSAVEVPADPAAAVRELIEAAAEQVHPGLGGAQVHKVLVGSRPVTLDGYPLIGQTSIPGVWILSGTRRDGFHLSPKLAEEMTRALSTGEQPFDGAFAPERSLRLEGSRPLGIERAVANRIAAHDERRLSGAPAAALEAHVVRAEVLDAYARCGLDAHDVAIPAELLELYRDGYAAANLAAWFAAGAAPKGTQG
jgi:glycine oxidase